MSFPGVLKKNVYLGQNALFYGNTHFKSNIIIKFELGGKEKKHEFRATASDEPSGLSGLSPTGAQSSQKPLKTGIWT